MNKILNDTRKADLLAKCADLGNAEGRGMNAKPDYARACLMASMDGVIGTNDAATVWKAYSDAMQRTKGEEHKRLANVDKVRTSETKRFIMVGAMVQISPVDLFDRAIAVIHDKAGKGSTYENLVKVMREQTKNANEALTDQAIEDVLNPLPPEKDEKTTLEALLKSLKKAHDGTAGTDDTPPKPGFPSDELAEAIRQIETRLATIVQKDRIAEMLKIAAETGYDVKAAA